MDSKGEFHRGGTTEDIDRGFTYISISGKTLPKIVEIRLYNPLASTTRYNDVCLISKCLESLGI